MTASHQDFGVSSIIAARFVAFAFLLVGVVVVVSSWGVASFGWYADVVVIAAAVSLVGASGTAYFMRSRAWVMRLTDEGYQVRFVRGAGVTRARWRDVEDLVSSTVAGENCLELRLRNGGSTTLPVRFVAHDPEDLARLIGARLQSGMRKL